METVLAKRIIAGDVAAGDVVVADVKNERLVLLTQSNEAEVVASSHVAAGADRVEPLL